MHFTLKMEAERSSKILVSYCDSTWSDNPQDLDLNLHCCENHKSLNPALCSRGPLESIFCLRVLVIFLKAYAITVP
jgi:hypothetical protein